jgi:hypothetical protein
VEVTEGVVVPSGVEIMGAPVIGAGVITDGAMLVGTVGGEVMTGPVTVLGRIGLLMVVGG